MARYGSAQVEEQLVFADDDHYSWTSKMYSLHSWYCLECGFEFFGDAETDHCPACGSHDVHKLF